MGLAVDRFAENRALGVDGLGEVDSVDIDGQKFTMFTKKDGAWMANPAEERKLVAAMKAGREMVVSGVSARGTQTTYTYSLSGVTAAILSGEPTVWIAVYEWSGRRQSVIVLDWTPLTDEAALQQAVAQILAAPRSHNRFPTAMGYALGYGATMRWFERHDLAVAVLANSDGAARALPAAAVALLLLLALT